MALMLVDILEDIQERAPAVRNDINHSYLDLTAALDGVVSKFEGMFLLLPGLPEHPVRGTVPSFLLEVEGHLKIKI